MPRKRDNAYRGRKGLGVSFNFEEEIVTPIDEHTLELIWLHLNKANTGKHITFINNIQEVEKDTKNIYYVCYNTSAGKYNGIAHFTAIYVDHGTECIRTFNSLGLNNCNTEEAKVHSLLKQYKGYQRIDNFGKQYQHGHSATCGEWSALFLSDPNGFNSQGQFKVYPNNSSTASSKPVIKNNDRNLVEYIDKFYSLKS